MRRILAATAALTCAVIVSPANAQWAGHQAVRSSAFQDSIGINVHINARWDTAYSDAANGGAGWAGNNAAYGPVLVNGRTQTNVSKIVQALWYTGIGHVRVSVGDTYVADRIQAVLQAVPWLRIDLQTSNQNGAIWDQLNRVAPFAWIVEAIEGINEGADNASYEGLWAADADCRYQSELFWAAQSWNSQHGMNVPVLAPSASGEDWPSFGRIASCAWASNAANAHAYTDNNSPTWKMWVDRQYWIKDAPAGAPIWASEAGYATNQAVPYGLSEDAAAKRTLSALLTFHANNIVRTYLYEMVDEWPQTPRVGDYDWAELEWHYGLYNNNWSPKKTARMLHSQLQIIQDFGPNPYGFSPGYMWYNIQNQPGSTYSFLMQKSDGSWLLALWAEPPGMYVAATNSSWGYDTNTPTSYPTITFDRSFSLIQTADPFAAGWDTPSYNWAGAYTNKVTVPLSDHVIYLILKP